MALLICPDCSGKVSDQAAACPHCGRPMTLPTAPQKQESAHAQADREAEARRAGLAERTARATPHYQVVSSDRAPAIPRAGRYVVGGIALLLVAALVAIPRGSSTRGELGGAAYATGVSAIPDTFAAAPAPASVGTPELVVTAPAALVGQQWRYDHGDDGMSKGTEHTATVRSSNTVDFSFPYGGEQHATLTLRTHPRYGKNVIFSIERGQLLCRSYDDCSVLVRFDDQAAQTFSANGAADNSTETLFITNYVRFLAAMRKATRVRIAANVYQQGAPSFEFDVSGFNVASYVPPAIGPAAPPTKKRTRRSCDPNDPGCVTGVPGEIP